MRRISLSVVLGLVFPILCFIAIGFSTGYMQRSALTDIEIYDQTAPGLLFAPFSIPIYLIMFLEHKRISPIFFPFKVFFRILSFVFFNWSLYGAIFYLTLGRFKRFKKQTAEFSETPPKPPVFEQED